MDSAGTLADFMYYGGVITCIGAIATGIVLAVMTFMQSGRPAPVFPSAQPSLAPRAQEELDQQIRKIEGLP